MPGDELKEIVEGAADTDEKGHDKGLVAEGAKIAAGAREIESDGEERPGDGDPLGADFKAKESGDGNGAEPEHDRAHARGLRGGQSVVKIDCGEQRNGDDRSGERADAGEGVEVGDEDAREAEEDQDA